MLDSKQVQNPYCPKYYPLSGRVTSNLERIWRSGRPHLPLKVGLGIETVFLTQLLAGV